MFKSFYTTQMSSSSKLLETRFSKMRSGNGKFSKIAALIVSLVLALTLAGVTLVMGAVDGFEEDDYTVVVSNYGESLELKNKPFYENGTVYLPLREMFEKIGVMDNADSKIEWNNGVVQICISETASETTVNDETKTIDTAVKYVLRDFRLEIGKSELVHNAAKSLAGQDMSKPEPMELAPVLRDGVTYVPFDYIRVMLRTGSVNRQKYNIVCMVYENKSGGVVRLDAMSVPESAVFEYDSAVLKSYIDNFLKRTGYYSPYTYAVIGHSFNEAGNEAEIEIVIKPLSLDSYGDLNQAELYNLKMKVMKVDGEWTFKDGVMAIE